VVKHTEARVTEDLATRIQVGTAGIHTMVTETQDGVETHMEVIGCDLSATFTRGTCA